MVGRSPTRDRDDRSLCELMISYQEGDLRAFDEIYAQTLPMIRGYLRTFVWDSARLADLIQETYLQFHRSRATYDPAFPLRPWLMGIARYVRLQERRSLARRLGAGLVGTEALENVAVPPEMEGLADREALANAMARLPDDWREAIVLHHIQGLSFREIGMIAAVSEGAARIRASRGMSKLRRILTTGKTQE